MVYKHYMKYIIALLLFGSNGIVASRIALNSYEIVFMRTLIGALFLVILYLFDQKHKMYFFKNKLSFLFLVLSGAAMGSSWLFLYEGYYQIGVSISTLAYYCGPVIVMVLSPFIFKENITMPKVIGFLFVLLGMIFVNGTQIFAEGISWGLVCGIFSALFYALMMICSKKAHDFTGFKFTGLESTICQLTVSTIIVVIFMFLRQPEGVSIPKDSLFFVFFLGIVNTGIGCYFYFSSIPKLSAQSVSICSYIEPFSALLFSAIFLQEKLSPLQIIGAAFILCGAAFGELYQNKKKKTALP